MKRLYRRVLSAAGRIRHAIERRVMCLRGQHEFSVAAITNRVFEVGPTRTSVLLRCDCGKELWP